MCKMEAKIYTIESIDRITGEMSLYVGSTKDLDTRYIKHKSDLKNINSSNHYYKLYSHLRENDNCLAMNEIDTCLIEERFIREQEWMDRLNPNLNNVRAYSSPEYRKESDKVWRENNKVIQAEKQKTFRDANKGLISQSNKEQYYKNHEKNLVRVKEYTKNNKVALALKRKEKITCECGKVVCKGSLKTHKKSKKHARYG